MAATEDHNAPDWGEAGGRGRPDRPWLPSDSTPRFRRSAGRAVQGLTLGLRSRRQAWGSNPEGDGDANDTRQDEATMTRLLDALRRLVGSTPPACAHLDQVRDVQPRTVGCEECLAIGGSWVELRLCLGCGHVGCCDLSPNRHARAHYTETGHAIIRANMPGYTWTWCWIDEIKV